MWFIWDLWHHCFYYRVYILLVLLSCFRYELCKSLLTLLLLLHYSSLLPSIFPGTALTLQRDRLLWCLSLCRLYSSMCWKTNGYKYTRYTPWHDGTQCQAYLSGPPLLKDKMVVFKSNAMCEPRPRRWYFALSWFPPKLYDAGLGSHVGAVTADGDKCRDSKVSLPPAQFSTG